MVLIMGRTKKYFTETEKREAIKKTKNKYMLNKEWLCPNCSFRNYTLAGKWCHINTNKHKINAEKNITQ